MSRRGLICSVSVSFLNELERAQAHLIILRTERKESLVLGWRTESHHIFHAGSVVPTPVEDHDLASAGKVLHVELKE